MRAKFVFIISTYGRNGLLGRVVDKINSCGSGHSYVIIIYNDGNDRGSFEEEFGGRENVRIIHGSGNNGKHFYWRSVNVLLEEASRWDCEYVVQIDDDHYPTSDFFTKIESECRDNPGSVIKIVVNENYFSERWGMRMWVDGGTLYPRRVFEKIGFYINEIPMSRWASNPLLSSGVWQQVSMRMNERGFNVVTPERSYANHLGFEESVMNAELRRTQPLRTFNFED